MSPRAMHPDHRHIPCPTALLPFVPPLRRNPTALLIDTGYAPLLREDRPPLVRVEPVTPPPVLHHYADRRCVDCQKTFTPKAGNQVRCHGCGLLHRKATLRAQKTTTITRAVGPRSVRWERAQATRKVNAATRHRAKSGQRTACA